MIFGAMADKAPRSRFIAALPLGFLAVLLGSISFDCVNAHGYVESPRSRSFLAYVEGREQGQGTSTTPLKEYTPQGINQMQTAGRCGMGDNGIGAAWRQYDAPKNSQGGILPPKIQATYVKGQQIDLQVVLTAHHKGHFTYSACALSAGQTTATQQCFDANKLMFVQDNLYGAPKDSRYPDRAYIPLESFPGIQVVPNIGGPQRAYKFNHRFQLPAGLSGDVVLIQWTYWTANSCIYPGYRTMSWPANYYDQGGLPDCTRTDFVTYMGGLGNLPELFWNCVEVKILNTPAPAPVPAPLPAPQPTTTSCNVIEENIDYTKSDICTTCPTSSTAEGCCSICAKTSGCGAYTWTNFNGGTCWLKSGKNGSTACSGCRSATMKNPVPIPGGNGVTVCQDSNYAGLCVTLTPGDYDLPAMTSRGVQNDWVSSVKVPSGFSMTGYLDSGFVGSSVTYTTDTAFVGVDWNDKISSLKVTSVTTGGKLIGQWQTCRKNVDWCDPNWTCCVAPADVATQKATCRPTCCGYCA